MASLSGVGLVGWGVFGGNAAAGRSNDAGGNSAGQPAAARPDPVLQARLQQARLAEQQRQQRANRLTAALKAYAEQKPEFGLAVVDHRTGQRYGYQGDRKFPMASTVKVGILAALLLQAQDDQRELTAAERSLASNMIRESNNEATTALYQKIGQVSGLTTANRRFGLTNTAVNPAWGMTRTTAEDQARLLAAILDKNGPLKAPARTFISELMGSVVPNQQWGISAAARDAEKTLIKNGWLADESNRNLFIINSLGRITGNGVDVSIVVLSNGNATELGGRAMVAEIAKLSRKHLGW